MRILAPLVLAAHLVDVGSPVSTNPVQDSATHGSAVEDSAIVAPNNDPDQFLPSLDLENANYLAEASYGYFVPCMVFRGMLDQIFMGKLLQSNFPDNFTRADFETARLAIANERECLLPKAAPHCGYGRSPERALNCAQFNSIRAYLGASLRGAQFSADNASTPDKVVGAVCAQLRQRVAQVRPSF